MKLFHCVTFLSAVAVASAATVADPDFVPVNEGTKKLNLCESDCDVDSDCVDGLMCADAHKPELAMIGLDVRSANCIVQKPWNYEVCFDPKILSGGGAGGDPHFRTYDGTKYTYHGECDLVMAHGTMNDNTELDLHARTKIVDNWSLISNAALRIGDDIFEVDSFLESHYFNGAKDVAFPIHLDGKYSVTSEEQDIDTTNEQGERVLSKQTVYMIDLMGQGSITFTNFMTMLSVRVDAYFEDTYGMLGHRTKDGLIGRDGVTPAVNENDMGSQWQVRDVEPLLFNEMSYPQYPERCILPDATSSPKRRLRDPTDDIVKKACSNVVKEMERFCIEDVIRTGDVKAAHIYMTATW